MTDYSQFEASIKSGIHPDPKRVRKMDEITGVVLKQRKESKIICVICILLAIAFFRIKLAFTVVFGLMALFFLWRGTGQIPDSYLKEIYEEGLLVPGIIVKTHPLTVMAISNMVAHDGAETINGCYNLVVKDIDGAKKELYEKIPCSCFFNYSNGFYHSAFQPHPLYWGTSNKEEINSALMAIEESNKENSQDEWEVLKRIASQFPDLKNSEIVLLDKDYMPFGIKHHDSEGYTPLNMETPLNRDFNAPPAEQYKKTGSKNEKDTSETDIPYITQDMPGKNIYNKMIKLAFNHNVYKYISGHCEYGPVIIAEHPGLFTYIGNHAQFLECVHGSNISLQEGEYPLIYEKYLVTTKGYYKDGKLLSWDNVKFSVKFNSLNGIKLYLNDEKFAEFSTHIDNYKNIENMSALEIQMVLHNEALNVLEFLQELQNLQ